MATSTLLEAPKAPPGERRRGPDRRAALGDRRRTRRDRRRGGRDERPAPVERRSGAERRSGRPDRRLGGDRRGLLRPPPGPPAFDPDVVFWAVNVVCWAAITVVALIYGA